MIRLLLHVYQMPSAALLHHGNDAGLIRVSRLDATPRLEIHFLREGHIQLLQPDADAQNQQHNGGSGDGKRYTVTLGAELPETEHQQSQKTGGRRRGKVAYGRSHDQCSQQGESAGNEQETLAAVSPDYGKHDQRDGERRPEEKPPDRLRLERAELDLGG